MKRTNPYWWLWPLLFAVAAHAAVSLAVPKSYGLTAFGDILQSVLLATATAVMLWNAYRSRANARYFWFLNALGCAMWTVGTGFWVYYEVYLGDPSLPFPSLVDSVFFLHFVPMIAALALTPHIYREREEIQVGGLDFALLLLWWIYLYVLVVTPWQYIVEDRTQYGHSFNVLYFVEAWTLLAGLAYLWVRAGRKWRAVYVQLFIAGLIYVAASMLVNSGIIAAKYYTGSLYDVPLVTAMLWYIGAGLTARRLAPEPAVEPYPGRRNVWTSRLAMAAVLSMPVLASWVMLDHSVPEEVRDFRLLVTIAALFVLTFLVFLKQHVIDKELLRALDSSTEALDDLKRVQGQLVQAEKMASLGQLVAGAAHEINNPLTAILGYSELIAEDPSLAPEKRTLAEKIGQQARRVKSLVGDLLHFSRQTPSEKMLVNVNILLENALRMRESEYHARGLRLTKQLATELPYVHGDATQLLQLFSHLINNAADAMSGGGGMLSVCSREADGHLEIEFADSGTGVKDPQRVFDPFFTTKDVGKGAGLGLSACYGIVQQHGGSIECVNRPEGGALFKVRLPLAGDRSLVAVV